MKTKIITLWVLFGGKKPLLQPQHLPLEHIVTMLNMHSRPTDITYFVHEEDARDALTTLREASE